ncbi:mCG146131, partial [Mus musculus]
EGKNKKIVLGTVSNRVRLCLRGEQCHLCDVGWSRTQTAFVDTFNGNEYVKPRGVLVLTSSNIIIISWGRPC